MKVREKRQSVKKIKNKIVYSVPVKNRGHFVYVMYR